jgi:OFA family oxalate/formate antiporter-like MFS transporter
MIAEGGKRWVYLIAGALMMLFFGLIYAWSIFRVAFSEIYPAWNVSDLSMTFTISMVFFCIGGFISGKLSAKIGIRAIIMISALLLFIGFFKVSGLDTDNASQSLTTLYIFYGVFGGTGVGMGYNIIISTMSKWFPGKTGMVSGALLMSFGFGGMALGSAVSTTIEQIGLLSTFFRLAIIVPMVLMICSFFIKAPDDASRSVGSNAAFSNNKEYTTAQMLKTPTFWIMFLWTTIVSSSGLMVINSAATIALAFGAPAILGLIVSVFNGLGRVMMGAMFDKIGRRKSMFFNSGFAILAGGILLSGALAQNLVLIFIGLPLAGIFYGGSPPLTASVTNLFFGQKHYAINYSVANFAILPAAFIGPLISGALQDSSGGAYASTFLIMLCLGAVSLILNFALNRAGEETVDD